MSKQRFRPNTKILDSRFVDKPAFVAKQRYRGVRRAGILFETKVGDFLESCFGIRLVRGPWIAYEDSVHGVRTCSPDYLVIDVKAGVVTIVECKLTHTTDAWVQINDVYTPVVKHLFPGFEVRGIEVCKNFERSISYPVEPNIVCDVTQDFSGGDNVMVMWG